MEREASPRLATDSLLLEAIRDTVAALVVVLDPRGRIVHLNRHAAAVTGYETAEVVGEPVWDVFVASGEVEDVRRVFDDLSKGRFPSEHENAWLTREGERRLIHWKNTAIRDDSDSVVYVVGTGMDVTDRRAAEARARALMEEEAASRARDELISFVAHDLGNYAAATRLIAERLARRVDDRASGREAPRAGSGQEGAADPIRREVDDIRRAAAEMNRLIEDLLSAESKRLSDLELEIVPLSPRALIMEAIGLYRSRVDDREVDVHVAADPSLPFVLGDRGRLLQVLLNLLSNADKFSPEGAPIRIGADVVDGSVRISVADRGPGVAESDRERIFVRFWQRSPERGGAGVGLASARHIVQAHGGRIWVDDDGTPGSAFRFTVPMVEPDRR